MKTLLRIEQETHPHQSTRIHNLRLDNTMLRPRTGLLVLMQCMVMLAVVAAQMAFGATTRFAVFGDFDISQNSADVAAQVAAMNPDFIVTVGDQNYGTANSGSTASWDAAVGLYYHNFIKYPAGSASSYAPGAPLNRFFICLGNHDWDVGLASYTTYFDLPGVGIPGSGNTDGAERYYDFIRGNIHFFVMDSDTRETSGTAYNSNQGLWLSNRLAASTATWKFVMFHHPPFATPGGDQRTYMRWPFREWGADAVFSGHVHNYERIMLNGFPYVISGLGGRVKDNFGTPPASGSVVRYNTDYGFLMAEITDCTASFYLTNVHAPSAVRDSFILTKPALNTLDVAVAWAEDDVEESSAGILDFVSSDLEMIDDSAGSLPNQTVGMRFNRLESIPRGAQINNAYVQFTAKDPTSIATTLKIYGQGNAPIFSPTSKNLSTRINPAGPVVNWTTVPTWAAAGDAGVAQRTPPLNSIVQDIVNQSAWGVGALGDSLAIIITNGVDGSATSLRRAWSYNGTPAAAPVLHVEWTAAGKIDYSFDPGTGLNAGNYTACGVQADGKIVVGGVFTAVNGVSHTKLVRFNTDGSLDASFNPVITGGNVLSLALQADGKILIGGDFTSVNGAGFAYLARLNANGTTDGIEGTGINGQVWSIAVQPDGYIVVGGTFSVNNAGILYNNIIRLNPFCDVDTAFVPEAPYHGTDGGVLSVVLQPDGKILIGGWFAHVGASTRGGVARLNANGSVDSAFGNLGGTGPSPGVSTVALQADGKVLIGGYFTTVNGVSRANLGRLNAADGSLDLGFAPSVNASVYSLLYRADGKICLAGQFTTVGGTARGKIARINADGTLDTSFDPGTGLTAATGGYGWALSPQPCDGKIIVTGSFSSFNGVSRNNVLRLHGY